MLHGKELRVHDFEKIGHNDASVMDLSLMRFWFAMSQLLFIDGCQQTNYVCMELCGQRTCENM